MSTNKIEIEGCPVCGQKGSKCLWQTTWPEHGYPGTFVIRQCRHCRALFNSPRLDKASLENLYSSNYYIFLRPDRVEFERAVATYLRTVDLVHDHLPNKTLLDVGCARGHFPALLESMGWDTQGIEISTSAAESAKRNFQLNIYRGALEDYVESNLLRKFQVVTVIDVIEHVPEPRKFVKALFDVVEPGGIVIIDTPNSCASNIKTEETRWPGFNPFHIIVFNIDNLTDLLKNAGFTPILAFSYGNGRQRPATLRFLRHIKIKIASLLARFGLLEAFTAALGLLRRVMLKIQPNPQATLERARQDVMDTSNRNKSSRDSTTYAPKDAGDNLVIIARRT